MAENSSQNPGKSTLFWIILIVIALYLFKVALREPQYRHVEVCFLPHKIGHFFWVDAWGMVVPDDNRSLLKHSRDLEAFFFNCTNTTKHWSFLRFDEAQTSRSK